MNKYKYLIAYTMPAIILFSLMSRGIWTYAAVVYAFVLVPLLELFLNPSNSNLTDEAENHLKNDIYFDIVIYSMVVFHLIILAVFLFRLSHIDLLFYEKIGMMIAMGISLGVLGINIAHELGHRTKSFEQTLSKIQLLTSQYLHFFIEHNRGHHRNVSTDEDAASAYRDETIYFFFFRTIKNSWLNAWQLEKERLQRIQTPFFSWKNQMLRFQVYQFIFCVFIIAYFGWEIFGYYLGAAIIGFHLLESVNYIQHYGLRRAKTENGYERVSIYHSWNSDYPLGRIILFDLSRHSDHHRVATRPYQILQTYSQAPTLPTGYPGSILLAFIPPFWFHKIHPIIDKTTMDR